MTLQGDAHEDLGNMVLADSERGYKALVDSWPMAPAPPAEETPEIYGP